MTPTRRDLLVGALGGAAAAWLPGSLFAQSAPPVSATPVRGGTLTVAIPVEPVHLNVAFSTQGGTSEISPKIFDSLLAFDLDNQPRGGLAESWEISDDGLSYTFHLRPGVTWHDGVPFTSDDVAFSLEIWQKYNPRGKITFGQVTEVLTPDPLTAIFRLSAPSPTLLQALSPRTAPVLARHSYPAEGDLAADPRNSAPIGTGPFRFQEWERGSHVVLLRNEAYWDQPRPFVDRLIIRTIPDAATASAALESGQVDASNHISLSNVVRLSKKDGLKVIDDPRGSVFRVGAVVFEYNLDRAQFRDRRLREALAHAIDRDFIAKNLYFGYAQPTHSPLPPDFQPWHNPDVPRYDFDLAKAEALLEDAGYKRDGDGIRLRLTIDPAASSTVHLQIAQFLRGSFAKIGVDLVVRAEEFGQFVNRVYTKRDFDTALYFGAVGPDPLVGVQRFYWSKSFEPGVAFSNTANYANPEVDRLLEAAAIEVNTARRKALYDDFQAIVQTDLVRVPLVSTRFPTVVRADLEDFLNSPLGGYGNLASAYFQQKA